MSCVGGGARGIMEQLDAVIDHFAMKRGGRVLALDNAQIGKAFEGLILLHGADSHQHRTIKSVHGGECTIQPVQRGNSGQPLANLLARPALCCRSIGRH